MAANTQSAFKIIKTLEWCTEIPTLNNPRQSPVFVLNSNECFFLLDMSIAGYCELYLNLKKKNTEVRTCNVTLQVGFKNEGVLSLDKKEIAIKSELKSEVWYIHSKDLHYKLPDDYAAGNFLKLVFCFDSTNDILLKIIDRSDKEFLQVSSYAKSDILFEGISKDFSKLLDDDLDHDVEFICEDQIFKAHKKVLSCRSDVFASMLQSGMIEGRTGQIVIQDMDPTIFQQFLRCLYSGKLQDMTVDSAVSLYKAGDKYHVDSLKKYCADFLIGNLSFENFNNILIFADLHNDTDFKNSVMAYIIEEKVPYYAEKWPDFCKENPVLAIEVLNLFCQHLRPK